MSDLERINATLERVVREVPEGHNRLYIAARYSLLGGGKRIRPLLAIATGKMLGADLEALLNPACALEMIHTYSLIHDDLPAIDNDDFRRGKPSLHKAYGDANALLAGDFLLTYAFEVLSEAPLLSSEQRLKLISTLAKASGGEGMIGGQIMDIAKKGHCLEKINAMKTGALLTASMQFGGIIAGVNPQIYDSLTLLGQKIGLLFQICDDILDGERASDLKEAKEEALALHTSSLTILNQIPGNSTVLESLFKKIISQID